MLVLFFRLRLGDRLVQYGDEVVGSFFSSIMIGDHTELFGVTATDNNCTIMTQRAAP